TFTYTISDSEGATDTATVTVTVASVDDFPEAKDDAFSTDEDVVLSGDLATNDTLSGDGGNLFGKFTDPSHGSVTVNADGTFDYTPDAEFSGTDSFIYSLTDADGDVSTATAVITINYVNDEPTPSPDVSATGEDLGVAIDVSTNDSDPEGDPVGVVEINGQTASVGIPVGLSSGATATLLSDGTIYYDPNGAYDELKNGQTDTDTFSYGSGDGDGITATTVTVTVTGSDDAVNNNAFQVTGGQLNYLAFDPSTTSFVNTPIGDNPGNAGNYNAMAFNSVDSQLYAIDGSNLIRIDPENGEVTIIASGLTDSEYTGDFNPGDGYLYAKRGNSSDWNVYNVQDGTKVTSFTQSTSASFNDIAYDPTSSLFWGAQGTTVYSMDTIGTIKTYANAITLEGSDSNAWGGAFADGNGNIALLNNGSGRIFSLDTTTGQASYLIDGNPSGQNDGAADPTVANDLFRPHVVLDPDTSTGGRPHAAYGRFTVGGSPIGIADSDGYVTDFNSPNLEGMTITLTNAQTGDVLDTSGIPGTIMASTSAVVGRITVTLTGTASLSDYTDALRAITFENTEGSPSITPRFIEVTATDGSGTSSEAQMTIFLVTSTLPIVIDLDGDGAEFLSAAEGIRFDVDGDGNEEQTAWAAPDDAVLFFDRNGDGLVTDHEEISFVGYVDGAQTDLEGLRHFDTNQDGSLTSSDAAYDSFAIWQDRNGDGDSSADEVQSLSEAGIESIALISDEESYLAADGDVTVQGEATVQFVDGSTTTAADSGFLFYEIVQPEGFDAPLEVMTNQGGVVNLDNPANESQPEAEPDSASSDDSESGPMPMVSAEDDAAAAAAAA
ncbi:MAG: Ig-like domain-containing protein, partial [Verrucomicrobiota bacterium]